MNASFYLMQLTDARCFDQKNLTLGGDFSGDYVMYYDITLTPCVNSSRNNNSCANTEELKSYFDQEDLMLALHHESLSYNSSNNKVPLSKFLIEDDYRIDNKVCKILYFYMQSFTVLTDNGFFSSDINNITIHNFDYVKSDFRLNKPGDNCLFNIKILSSINTRIQTRTYVTIYSIIAEVGGALNAYLILFRLLL